MRARSPSRDNQCNVAKFRELLPWLRSPAASGNGSSSPSKFDSKIKYFDFRCSSQDGMPKYTTSSITTSRAMCVLETLPNGPLPSTGRVCRYIRIARLCEISTMRFVLDGRKNRQAVNASALVWHGYSLGSHRRLAGLAEVPWTFTRNCLVSFRELRRRHPIA